MRLWNGWGNENSDHTMELNDGLRKLWLDLEQLSLKQRWTL